MNNIQEKDWADENNWGAHSGMSNDSEYSTVDVPGDQTRQNVAKQNTTDQSESIQRTCDGDRLD